MKWIIGTIVATSLWVNSATACNCNSTSSYPTTIKYHENRLAGDIRNLKPNDRPVPIPWGKETDFPWDNIQGSWVVQDKDFASIYTIKVLKDKATKTKKVFIRQYDPDTCELLSEGSGTVDSTRAAYATMKDQTRAPYYYLSIRSFLEADMRESSSQYFKAKNVNGQVYIFSIVTFAHANTEHNLTAERVSRKTELNCK